MIGVVSKYLTPKGFRGLTVFPFVFMKSKAEKFDAVFINHERIHLRQQIKMLIIPFFVWYFLEYLIRLFQYKNRNLAYKNICFEREAYQNEMNLDHLSKRTIFRFIRCL